jgi:hypothetical protein
MLGIPWKFEITAELRRSCGETQRLLGQTLTATYLLLAGSPTSLL